MKNFLYIFYFIYRYIKSSIYYSNLFLITVGDNFDERSVKFGDVDSLNNENIDHPGQSVIQHCRSYIFNLNDSDRKTTLYY